MEVVLTSSGSKNKSAIEANIVIGNGLMGDKYIDELDGAVCIISPIGEYSYLAKNDRLIVSLTGEYGMFTEKQKEALLPTMLIIKKLFGVPRIIRYEDFMDNPDARYETISDKYLSHLQHHTKILWKQEE